MGDPRFTAANLYGPSGRPQATDIDQDRLNDCYLLAPMGALARQQPRTLQDAISYDADSQSFRVTLYRDGPDGPKPVVMTVDQEDLADNLARHGGSTVDNNDEGRGAIWPAVMETAYAELQDKGSRDANYAAIEFGHPQTAMQALTGQPGRNLEAADVARLGDEATLTEVQTALKEGRPVTLGTFTEDIRRTDAEDGLGDQHMYMIEGARKQGDDVVLDLRNPLAENVAYEGRDTPSPTTTVTLAQLRDAGTLGVIHIGPQAPAQSAAQPEAAKPEAAQPGAGQPAASPSSSATGTREIDALFDSLGDPARFRQALRELADSPTGQAFREEMRKHATPAQEQQAPERAAPQADAPAQAAPTREAPVLQHEAPTQQAPVMSLSR